MDIQQLFLAAGIEAKFLIGGIIGTIAGVSNKKGNWLAKIGTVFTGAGGATYLTPLASELLGITNEQSKIGIAVLIGYLGIVGLQNILLKKLDEWKQ